MYFRRKKLLLNWHASLIEETTMKIVCTGVKIEQDWAVLAASCTLGEVDSKSWHKYKIIIGSFTRNKAIVRNQLRDILQVHIHPEYDGKYDSTSDIAAIQLLPSTSNRENVAESLCIMSHNDLTDSIQAFRNGLMSASMKAATRRASVGVHRVKVASKLCSSGQFMCSRLVNTNSSQYNLHHSPVYVRYGISDTDWGLAGLTTIKSRKTRLGGSIIHRHIPLYAHVSWLEHVMGRINSWT